MWGSSTYVCIGIYGKLCLSYSPALRPSMKVNASQDDQLNGKLLNQSPHTIIVIKVIKIMATIVIIIVIIVIIVRIIVIIVIIIIIVIIVTIIIVISLVWDL